MYNKDEHSDSCHSSSAVDMWHWEHEEKSWITFSLGSVKAVWLTLMGPSPICQTVRPARPLPFFLLLLLQNPFLPITLSPRCMVNLFSPSSVLSYFIMSSFSVAILLSLPSSYLNDLHYPHLQHRCNANEEWVVHPPPPSFLQALSNTYILPPIVLLSHILSVPLPTSLSSLLQSLLSTSFLSPPIYIFSISSLFAFLCRCLPPLSGLWTPCCWKPCGPAPFISVRLH